MSRLIFNAVLGGTTTLESTNSADTFLITVPAANGTMSIKDSSGDATFRNITLTGAVLAGAWNGSTIAVGYGGTGATTLTGYVKGNGTSAMTASTTIPNTDITGLGTMSTQNSNAVTITGGTISGLGTPLPVASGGSGAATLTGYLTGNGTSAYTASTTIPNTDITGLGTMSTQGADAVAITGGTANGLTIGASNPAAGIFTTLRFNSTLSANGSTGTSGQVLTSNGASAPTWQSIAGSGTVTSVDVSGGTTGLTTSGGPVTGAGTITLAGTLAIANGGTGATSAANALTALGAYPATNPSGFGVGTVTSVAAITLGTTGTDLSSSVATGTTTPVITLNVPTASAANRGVLSAADWTTFNNKGAGTITSVTGTAPVVSSGGTTPAISMAAANTTTNGYLTSTDWNTFNNKGAGTVTSVTGTAPVVSSGGATPAISMAAASTSVSGYLTSTDWNTFNDKGAGPSFSAYQSSAQTLSSGTWTKINLQTEEWDTNSNFDSTTNYRFTPTVGGYYQVNGAVAIASTNTAITTALYKNGSNYKISNQSNNFMFIGNVSALVFLNGSTDYIEMYCNIGLGQALSTGSITTYFQAALVRSS
jgi:hypothetical protein